MTLQIAACPNHPQREAIGICVRCRARVCSECATKVDGINYCVRCLAELAQGAGGRASQERGELRAYLSAAGYLVLMTLLVWGLLEVTFATPLELAR